MIPCSNCGCIGNTECGHDVLDKHNICMVNDFGVCACCDKVSEPMTDAEEDEFTGQANLFTTEDLKGR